MVKKKMRDTKYHCIMVLSYSNIQTIINLSGNSCVLSKL